MRFKSILLALAFCAVTLCIPTAHAADDPSLEPEKPTTNPANRKPSSSPSLQVAQEDPSLPRVLLIGDSISQGYTLRVRKLLKGKANVQRPLTNCGATSKAMIELGNWLTTDNTGGAPARKWDVIHFNFGLHDLKYVDDKGRTVTPAQGHQNVSPADYEKNLRAVVAKLKQTGATLIWCTTTPVPDGLPGHSPAEVTRYNEIAAKVIKENDIATDDIYSLVKPRESELQLDANVHFRSPGYDVIADQVAGSIEKALETKKESK